MFGICYRSSEVRPIIQEIGNRDSVIDVFSGLVVEGSYLSIPKFFAVCGLSESDITYWIISREPFVYGGLVGACVGGFKFSRCIELDCVGDKLSLSELDVIRALVYCDLGTNNISDYFGSTGFSSASLNGCCVSVGGKDYELGCLLHSPYFSSLGAYLFARGYLSLPLLSGTQLYCSEVDLRSESFWFFDLGGTMVKVAKGSDCLLRLRVPVWRGTLLLASLFVMCLRSGELIGSDWSHNLYSPLDCVVNDCVNKGYVSVIY